jgi:hypothetical protein
MPDDQAQAKYDILSALGATVEKVRPCSIVDSNHFVNIAKRRAREFTALHSGSDRRGLFCDQFESEANYETHYFTTGPEIYRQVDEIDAFVMGAGIWFYLMSQVQEALSLVLLHFSNHCFRVLISCWQIHRGQDCFPKSSMVFYTLLWKKKDRERGIRSIR